MRLLVEVPAQSFELSLTEVHSLRANLHRRPKKSNFALMPDLNNRNAIARPQSSVVCIHGHVQQCGASQSRTKHVQKHSPTVTRRAVAACRPPAQPDASGNIAQMHGASTDSSRCIGRVRSHSVPRPDINHPLFSFFLVSSRIFLTWAGLPGRSAGDLKQESLIRQEMASAFSPPLSSPAPAARNM